MTPVILLVDTTMLYSALFFDGNERKVLTSGKFIFVTTDHNILEIIDVIKEAYNWSSKKINELISSLPVFVIPKKDYSDNLKKAYELMGERDIGDVPLLALYFSMDTDGIWTSDTDFDIVRDKVRIWGSKELLSILE